MRALCVPAEQRPESAKGQTGPFSFCSDPAVVNVRNVILGRDRLEPSYCYLLLHVPTRTNISNNNKAYHDYFDNSELPAAIVTAFTTTTTSSTTVTTSTATVTTTTIVTNDPAPAKMRRQTNAVKKDPGNNKPCTSASDNDVKSRACSCILGASPTITVLKTATTSSTITSYSTLTLTATLPDVTESRTITITSLETKTSTSTLTVTETSTTTSPPPSLKTCAFGTAFGYQNPVGGVQKSTPLNTQSGSGCNRWGWYETPTLAELQGGISGPLYVGVGGNDITQAIDIGIWVATANALGRVTVTYLLNPPYALSAVHVQLACLPISTCNQAQYTYNAGAIPNLPTWSNPTPLVYPTCSGGSRASLIVHASTNILTVTATCPPPKAV
ncbi:beta-glucosidase btgE [Pyrenophora seminiperda CCB06]|uniref:Beta-glucosidase btgE n=1 Tax=Pyrenophora seminiperda CCB06 TaxID=1302712 RepID=A0A3M7MGJ2_9PLEO|nr:beta-glucosidase btgE [Pyrenophora seminiperda CCB06]